MHVVHIAAEFAPLIKAGGLADVIHGLSVELAKQGNNVKVIVPLYKFLDKKKLGLSFPIKKFVINEKNAWHNNFAFYKKIDNIEVIFLEIHHPDKYFSQENIYGYETDISRFIYFSRAALEFLLIQKQVIDILHLHDWHTCICALIVKEILKKHHLKINSVVLTVHNFHYQGKCAPVDLDNIGLNGKKYLTQDLMQDPNLEFPHSINLLQGGIVFSDAFTTVSKTYARELLEKKHAYGLENIIKNNKDKLFGILNGIDDLQWNPAKDSALYYNFSSKLNTAKIHDAKVKNKKALFQELHLKDYEKPFFVFIGRLVKQKGIEILEKAIKHIIDRNGTFCLCGTTDEATTRKHFDLLKQKLAKNHNVHFHFDYNENLTRKLYASADFILVPSLFEPCGLVQLIAMRYGTIPIVRKTGGLNDSIEDFELNKGYQNGIVFDKFHENALICAIDRAFKLYEDTKEHQQLSKKIMQIDFGWEKSARKYLKLYKKLIS
jgi:starch synthase